MTIKSKPNTLDNTDTETIFAFHFRLYGLFSSLCFTRRGWLCEKHPRKKMPKTFDRSGTHGVDAGTRNQIIFVRGECFQHCAFPATSHPIRVLSDFLFL